MSATSLFRSRCRLKIAKPLTVALFVTAVIGGQGLSARSLRAADWPQFRGPNATGIAPSEASLPTEFSLEDNLKWSADLGDGVASPVIVGGRLYVTAMAGEEIFGIYCFDAAGGEQLWSKELDTGTLPPITPPNAHASSTPAVDDEGVYVYFSTLGLMAFDHVGNERWRVPLRLPIYFFDWGAAASPIVYKDLVIFNDDDDLQSYLIAIDKHTGQVRWRTERPEMLGGYAVPVVCEANGRTDVVVAGSGKLKGYDPETGEELWTCNTLLRTIMTTPVVHDGVIYLSVQSYGDTDRVLKYALLQWKDTNQDGKLTKQELAEPFWQKFDRGDENGDGVLVDDEISRAFQAPTNLVGGGNIIQAIRGGGQGDVTETHLLWNLDNNAPSSIASPLLLDNRLFLVKDGGISSSFDASSGEPVWYMKRIRNFGTYYASPVAGDGKIYVTGENGFVVVLEEGPELKILAKNDLRGSCVATPAIADGRLYFRTRDKLLCFGE